MLSNSHLFCLSKLSLSLFLFRASVRPKLSFFVTMSSTATPEARARSLAATCDASTEIARLASQEMATKKKASTLTLIDANDANEKTSPPRDSSPAEVDARVRALYYVMQSVEVRAAWVEAIGCGRAWRACNCESLFGLFFSSSLHQRLYFAAQTVVKKKKIYLPLSTPSL
jgi:hypothetical protein